MENTKRVGTYTQRDKKKGHKREEKSCRDKKEKEKTK